MKASYINSSSTALSKSILSLLNFLTFEIFGSTETVLELFGERADNGQRYSDGMRRPVSHGMLYAPNVRRARSTMKKETGNAED
jgi:hypothetical protein